MSDEFSLRGDMEQDLQDTKDGLNKATQPLQNKVNETLQDEIQERIQKQIAEQAAKNAAQTAAETAATSGAGGMAAAETADAIATTGGGASTAAAAETAAGAGTTVAAGEATIAAEGAAAGAGATVAEGAAAGSAGGPVGAIVGVVVGVVIAAASAIKQATDVSLDKDDPNGPKLNMITIIIAAGAFMLVAVCGTLLSKGIASSLSIGQETEFQNTKVDGENMAPAGDQYQAGTVTKEFNDELPLKNAIVTYTYGEDGKGVNDGLRATLDKALRKHCYNLIKDLEKYQGSINGHHYDAERSISTFYENRWPYDLGTSSFEPKIGNVLLPNGSYYGKDYPEWNPRYDDVNFAEILALMGMSAETDGSAYGLHWGELNYKDFMEYLQKEECYKYMYELGLKWVPVYKGTRPVEEPDGNGGTKTVDKEFEVTIEELDDGHAKYESPDECRTAPEDGTYQGYSCSWDYYYVEAEVKPFGLRELFAMSFSTTDPTGAADQMHIDFDQHTNLYMLNYQERVTRLYQRKLKISLYKPDGTFIKEVDALGPSYQTTRSIYSPIYDDITTNSWLIAHGWDGTGRSAWYYIDKTYNDKWEGITWDDDPGGSIPPGGDWKPVDGAKILDMYEYINQGWYPNTLRGASNHTIKKSGCLDCSVAMICMYYKRYHIPITDISKYVDASASLHTADALAAYGLTMGDSNYGNFQEGVIEEINNDRPVIIHIEGYWTSGDDGRPLHSTENGHFLVGMGYDETGIYVYDPGRKDNYHISYSDWAHVNGLYYRPVYP